MRTAVHRHLVTTRRNVVEAYPPGVPQDDPSLRDFRLHTVAEGETWSDVARRYSVSAEDIARANELTTRYRLSVGQILWVPPGPAKAPPSDASSQAASAPSAPSRR